MRPDISASRGGNLYALLKLDVCWFLNSLIELRCCFALSSYMDILKKFSIISGWSLNKLKYENLFNNMVSDPWSHPKDLSKFR